MSVYAIVYALLACGGEAKTRCRPSGWESAQYRGVLQRLMDADQANFRAQHKVPLVDPNSITLVSDPAVCEQAGRAMDSFARTIDPHGKHKPSTIPLYVYQVGEMHVVVDLLSPNDNDADFLYFFDDSWKSAGVAFVQ